MAYPQNYHHLNVSVHFYLGLIVAIMFHPLTTTRISPKREIFNTEPSKTQSCHFTHPKNFKHKMPRSLAPAPSPHFLPSGFCPAPSSGFHPSSPWNPFAIALVGAICTVFLFLSCHQIQRHCYTFHMITFSGNRTQRQRRRLNEHNPDELSQQFRSQGLDPYITRSLPIIQFKKKDEGELSQSSTECAVCLGEFEEGEGLKQLPNCSHFFHVSCIDTWLMTHSSCPLCRSQVFNHEYSVSVCSLEENPSREDLLRERSAMHQVLRSHILRSSILRG